MPPPPTARGPGTARSPILRNGLARPGRTRAAPLGAPSAPGPGRPLPPRRSRAHSGQGVVAAKVDLREFDVTRGEPGPGLTGQPQRPDMRRGEHNVGGDVAPS